MVDQAAIEMVLNRHLAGVVLQRPVRELVTDLLALYQEPRLVRIREGRPVLQGWVMELTYMQQTVLLTAIRGADGMRKHHEAKPLMRWYRRCILVSAMDGRVLHTPDEPGGGSFTGPIPCGQVGQETVHWSVRIQESVRNFLAARDEVPLHFYSHTMHAFEILGYKHPDEQTRQFWFDVYEKMCHALHLWPETHAQMGKRLGDNREQWLERDVDEAMLPPLKVTDGRIPCPRCGGRDTSVRFENDSGHGVVTGWRCDTIQGDPAQECATVTCGYEWEVTEDHR